MSSDQEAKWARVKKISSTHSLAATLIATVTFAAALTVPGGYDEKKGTAVLSAMPEFVAFVVTDM